MLFQRLIWCALGLALLLGSVQSVLQQFQTVPIILAAEVYEGAKVEPGAAPAAAATAAAPAPAAAAHQHAAGTPAHEHAAPAVPAIAAAPAAPVAEAAHEHGAEEWAPADGLERNGWTWVANVLHALSMALLALAVMAVWTWKRGSATSNVKLAFAVATAGWLSIHLWPSLGLHAEIPGMDAAPLQARQAWWLLAVGCAASACAVMAFSQRGWRIVVALLLLAVPFVIGAPHHSGDPLAGFSGEAHMKLEALGHQFILATHLLSISFWGLLGALSAWIYPRWLKPVVASYQPEPAVATA
jgi:cobalt transporter subunit CbtA